MPNDPDPDFAELSRTARRMRLRGKQNGGIPRPAGVFPMRVGKPWTFRYPHAQEHLFAR